jgi:hypothetical protein
MIQIVILLILTVLAVVGLAGILLLSAYCIAARIRKKSD